MGKSRLVRQDCEREEGQPPAARSWLETAQRAACAEGVARDGAHPQCAGHYGFATVREGIKYWRALEIHRDRKKKHRCISTFLSSTTRDTSRTSHRLCHSL